MTVGFARVRDAKRADAERLGEICRASWQLAYAGIVPHAHLQSMIETRSARRWRRAISSGRRPLVLEAGGVVAGYASYGRARKSGPFAGELYELYLDPDYQGIGLGEQLFESVRQRLDEAGVPGLLVWALSANQGACEFYRNRGGRRVASGSQCFGEERVAKTAFGWV